MGLFWSMKRDPGHLQGPYTKKDVTSPQEVILSIFNGHLSAEEVHDPMQQPVFTKKINRWFKDKKVKREEVVHERLKGTIFIPPGNIYQQNFWIKQ